MRVRRYDGMGWGGVGRMWGGWLRFIRGGGVDYGKRAKIIEGMGKYRFFRFLWLD